MTALARMGRIRCATAAIALSLLTVAPAAGAATPTSAAVLPRVTGSFNFVSMAPTPSGNGYWLAASGGKVEAFGDAVFHGDLSKTTLNSPIIAIAATADGNGYWLVGRDGGCLPSVMPRSSGAPATSC